MTTRLSGFDRAPERRDRNALVVANLPLVGYLVNDLCARATHLSREDLASVGAIALITAAEAYDPERGVPFGAYARQRILGALTDELRSTDWAGRGTRQRITAVTALQERLASELHRAPTVDELAAALGEAPAVVRETLAFAARRVTEIDEDVAGSLRSELPGPEEAAIIAERDHRLRAAIAALPERMRRIVVDLFYNDRSVTEIAAELGVTHSAVSQQRSQAMQLLRTAVAELRADAAAAVEPVAAAVASRQAAYLARFGELQHAMALAARRGADLAEAS
ncbi:sigma-70 family RNA polymerase sigma factor [Microcella daejeonensis]|uniref:Sigma-70 family RNA polymerase sigma factor n=1 Tax=Microcella daejeonensis TaxID=2994971 RepID=A0A9E8MLJ8_9MICO|nr:sigma-70 family RNA polymerase sigma factor [Microcella daejeonensis]WAB81746.1 sigma-70 family RNA polymerase sigma factor [Microcella daejeonensis]WAB83898.1 sigma-70 family RNA polymerase sigma factor [Microcella daejeonensis]